MICDAHIHVGYFDRKDCEKPFYYSPRRVCSVLRRCGVEEFIFSSTSMQTAGIVFPDVHAEAREVVRIWGRGAHPFLWVTGDYLDFDPSLSILDEGLYEGIKLHGRETDWLSRKLSRKLTHVLELASERQLPIMVHTGQDMDSHPRKWLKWARRYSDLRFNFAHGAPYEVVRPCLATAENVFIDISCVGEDDVMKLAESEFTDRILWGTDFPVLAARSGLPLTRDMRQSYQNYRRLDRCFDFAKTFHKFQGGIEEWHS